MTKERIWKWDNVRAFLILLVVLGHGMGYIEEGNPNVQVLHIWLYVFHMPLFMMISGMMAKRTVETGAKLKQKVLGYVILAFLLKFTYVAIQLFYDEYGGFALKAKWGTSWFVFVLGVFLALTYWLRKVPRRMLLVLSFILALFSGLDTGVGSDWQFARIITYYPYFLLGTMWDIHRYQPKKHLALWKAGSVVLLLILFAYIAQNVNMIYPGEDFIAGIRAYKAFWEGKDQAWGFWYRGLLYLIAIASSAAVVILAPAGKTFFSHLGERSLEIYVYHRPLLYIFAYAEGIEWIKDLWPAHWKLLYLGLAIPLCFLLTHPVLARPFDWFWKQLKDV